MQDRHNSHTDQPQDHNQSTSNATIHNTTSHHRCSSQRHPSIAEIATKNIRSMNAYTAVGFEVVELYKADAEEWAIVAWAIR